MVKYQAFKVHLPDLNLYLDNLIKKLHLSRSSWEFLSCLPCEVPSLKRKTKQLPLGIYGLAEGGVCALTQVHTVSSEGRSSMQHRLRADLENLPRKVPKPRSERSTCFCHLGRVENCGVRSGLHGGPQLVPASGLGSRGWCKVWPG